MSTVRHIAVCRGFSGPSVSVRALFQGTPAPFSMLGLAARALRPTLDLNVILVGEGRFGGGDLEEVDQAVESARDLFNGVDLGIGLVQRFSISEEEAGGFTDIDGPEEARALRDQWGFPGTAIDAFIVCTYAGATVGSGPIHGSCVGGDEPDSGLVVALEHRLEITATTLAHEIGHYLGLVHHPDPDNLMYMEVPNGRELEAQQVATMKSHCVLHPGCRPV